MEEQPYLRRSHRLTGVGCSPAVTRPTTQTLGGLQLAGLKCLIAICLWVPRHCPRCWTALPLSKVLNRPAVVQGAELPPRPAVLTHLLEQRLRGG